MMSRAPAPLLSSICGCWPPDDEAGSAPSGAAAEDEGPTPSWAEGYSSYNEMTLALARRCDPTLGDAPATDTEWMNWLLTIIECGYGAHQLDDGGWEFTISLEAAGTRARRP